MRNSASMMDDLPAPVLPTTPTCAMRSTLERKEESDQTKPNLSNKMKARAQPRGTHASRRCRAFHAVTAAAHLVAGLKVHRHALQHKRQVGPVSHLDALEHDGPGARPLGRRLRPAPRLCTRITACGIHTHTHTHTHKHTHQRRRTLGSLAITRAASHGVDVAIPTTRSTLFIVASSCAPIMIMKDLHACM